eukprot:IDg14748t1
MYKLGIRTAYSATAAAMEHHYSHDAIPYAMSHAPSNAEHHATANAPTLAARHEQL